MKSNSQGLELSVAPEFKWHPWWIASIIFGFHSSVWLFYKHIHGRNKMVPNGNRSLSLPLPALNCGTAFQSLLEWFQQNHFLKQGLKPTSLRELLMYEQTGVYHFRLLFVCFCFYNVYVFLIFICLYVSKLCCSAQWSTSVVLLCFINKNKYKKKQSWIHTLIFFFYYRAMSIITWHSYFLWKVMRYVTF